jgi:hypothetical protein
MPLCHSDILPELINSAGDRHAAKNTIHLGIEDAGAVSRRRV